MDKRKTLDVVGLELSCSEDMQYIIAYTENDSLNTGCAVKASGMNLMGLATVAVVNVCDKLKNDPMIQATFLKAMIDTLKNSKTLDSAIDMAISFNGRVLRTEEE